MTRVPALVLALAIPAAAGAQPRTLSPGDRNWTIHDEVRVETVAGVPAFTFHGGEAYYHDVAFENGTIAFDLATTPRRSFIGVRFRASSEGRFEEIYFRPHKSGLPDAVQYAPAFVDGRSQWQLYHLDGNTAATTFSHGVWIRVRIVVSARRAAVFLGASREPVMIVDRLALDPAPGFIGFWNFDVEEVAPGERLTSVANIVVSPNDVDYAFPPARVSPALPGVIREWEVSDGFVAPDGPIRELPARTMSGAWRSATTEPDGLLPFDRVTSLPRNARRGSVLARTKIRATSPGTAALRFGFSDDVSVFLNRRLIYSGVNGYSFNFPRRDGLITIDQATVYLPLIAGDNDVIFAVSDTFGGWALIAQRLR